MELATQSEVLKGEASVGIEIPRRAIVEVQGREVALLVNGHRAAGVHPIRWDGRDRAGQSLPAGVYFVAVRSGNGNMASRKIVRLE